MRNKAQITIFILFGFILLIGFSFIAYTNNGVKETEIEKVSVAPFDITQIKLYVENFNLPYYVYENLDFSPSISDIEKEISKYVDNNLKSCLKDFEKFKKQGFEIKQGEIKYDTAIERSSVLIKVDFPIAIKKEDKTIKLNEFKIKIDSPLSKIFNLTKEMVVIQLEDIDSVCLSCLYQLTNRNNLYLDIFDYDDSSLIFSIKDYNIKEDNLIKSPYTYNFAIKALNISCDNFVGTDDMFFIEMCADNLIKNLSKEIQIEDIPNFQVKFSEQFYYKVHALGTNLSFDDYSELFDITNNGIINFTPNFEQIGNHSLWIGVKDILGNQKFTNFNIEVIE